MKHNSDFENWKTSNDEFRGFVKATLERQEKTLDEIKTEVKSNLIEIKENFDKQDVKFSNQDRRIDGVEKEQSFIKGRLVVIFAGVSALLSAAVGLIVKWLSK